MREKLLYLVAGILSAVAVQAVSSIFIDPDGVEYPDGTYQTTASGGGGARRYYLTQDGYDGSEATTACVTGFHMASIWEIVDPSNLRYDTVLGRTNADSGQGPPVGSSSSSDWGWVRTGRIASEPWVDASDIEPGEDNCAAYQTGSFGYAGTRVRLSTVPWHSLTQTLLSPWVADWATCNTSTPLGVWCVED